LRFLFGDHVLDTACRELSRGGEQIALEPQVFDLLVYLLQNRERVVSKDDLLESVWGGRIVSDATLDSRIAAARRAVADSGTAQALIRTFARKGVLFVGELREEGAAAAPSKPSVIPARRGLGAWLHSRAALALVALVCATVVITAVIVEWSQLTAPNSGGGTAIVVMPFRNQGDGAAQAKIGEAIAERIAVELARPPATRIVGQNTAAAYADRSADSHQLYQKLRVRYAVDGSVAAAGGDMRVEAALVDTTADAVRWSDHFDFAGGASPQLADEIVSLIIRPLVLVLQQDEANRAAAKEPAE
jgi:DNA-binding winged helix-turn-helix (wHTH) protein/TolB-like protein